MSIDLNHVHPRHDAINLRLEEWARYCRVKPAVWCCQPMFRLYRAPKQWESDLQIRIEINTIDASEIEKAVSILPPKHRTAIRWFYVFSHTPVGRVRREIGVTSEGLKGLIDDGRDMIKNRLKEKLIDRG